MQALDRARERKQDELAPDQINMANAAGLDPRRMKDVAPRQANTMAEQFPTDSLGARSEKDREMAARLRLQSGDKLGYTPFGKLEARDEDFKWLQKKQAAIEEANFQLWFAQEYDRMSPAEKKRAKELYPAFYEQRKKLLKKQAKNLVKLATLKLEGPENFSDLHTEYLAETGQLDVGPLAALFTPELANGNMGFQASQAKFMRGLLNPFRVFGDTAPIPGGALIPSDTGLSGQGYNNLYASRVAQASYFGKPQPSSAALGITTGFPPMGEGAPAGAGDEQWYQKLAAQLGAQ